MTERSASERYAHALSATIVLQGVDHSLHAARNAVWEAGDRDLRDELQKVMDQMVRLELRAFQLRDRIGHDLDAEQRAERPKACDTIARDDLCNEFVCREPADHAGPHLPRRR